MSWFHMPNCVLTSYLTMLRRLEGRESLNQVAVIAVGTGAAEKKDRAAMIRRWQSTGEPVQRLSREERHAKMAAVGIMVVEG